MSDIFFRAAFDALTDHVAVLDACGRVVAVNSALEGFGDALGVSLRMGSPYMDVFRELYGGAPDDAAALDEGVRAVLGGERRRYGLEHPCHTQPRWFSAMVTPLPGPQDGAVIGGVVVQHRDITEFKEREAGYLYPRAPATR